MLEPRRQVASHASDSDYAPHARALLSKLGYVLLPPDEAPEPVLRVVREDRLAEVPEPHAEPIIVLTRGQAPKAAPGARVLATLRRPAGLHELYRLLQSALEEQPRAVPRVPTDLVARATSEGRSWELVVRSLSDSGCLVGGPKLPPLETRLALDIELPWGVHVKATAMASYQQGADLGLVFHGITLAERKELAKAVVSLLERL